MEHLHFDIVIIGMGLGAAAIAHQLWATDASILMVPGVGCARFKHLDGGILEPGQLHAAFGTSDGSPLHSVGAVHSFRRDEMEAWAISRVRDGVTVIGDFADLRVVPHASGKLGVHEEADRREIVASLIVLTEGASPKIGIAAGIRPDFEPADLLHFGRAILSQADRPAPVNGEWRTSWNMPGWYSVVPHPDGAIVSASARIENIMRSHRDGRDALQDFLKSPLATEIGLPNDAEEMGMELVPLRSTPRTSAVGTHAMVIAADANGSIDPRSPDRYRDVLTKGSELGRRIARQWPNITDWDDVNRPLHPMFTTHRTPYHDSSATGFIEEGAASALGTLRKIFTR